MQLLQGASMNSNDSNKLQYNVGDLVYWHRGVNWSYGIVLNIDIEDSTIVVYWFEDNRVAPAYRPNASWICNISQEQRKKNK